MASVAELQSKIHNAEQAIFEKQCELAEKRKKIEDADVSIEFAEVALHDSERALLVAESELGKVESERQQILPRYKQCTSNKEHQSRAAELKKEIGDAEGQLREADKKIRELDSKLHSVSATYKNERERRLLMITKVNALVDDLRNSLESKIAATLTVDDTTLPSAKQCIRVVCEVVQERESAISHWSRHATEISACVELKRQRATELKHEAEKNVAVMKESKHNEIKVVIERFEAERCALKREISEMKQAHALQLELLHNAKLVSDKIKGNPTDIAVQAQQPKRCIASPAEKVLREKHHDLEQDKQALLERIRSTTCERQKLLSATKDLRKQIDAEETKFAHSFRQLENDIQREQCESVALEKENRKLKEVCDTLATTLRSGFLLSQR